MEDPTPQIKNQGVQILLNRMDSHPEEFVPRGGRWNWVIDKVINRIDNNHARTDANVLHLRFLTDEEVNALYDKYMSLQDNEFTKAVMQQLLEDANEREQEANIVRSTPMMVIDSALRRSKHEVAPGSVFPTPLSSVR